MEREAVTPPTNETAVSEQGHEIEAGPNLAYLWSYLAEYGQMIVVSPRLPGVPLPLMSLMNACPKDPTEETAPEFLAEAQMLVAMAQEKEQEEVKDEEDTEDDTEEDPDRDESKKKLI